MNKGFIILTILTIVFAGCKKEAINKASTLQNAQSGTNSIAQTTAVTDSPTFSVVDNGDGTFTATLQPDDSNGQDVHVYKKQGDPTIANTNFNGVPELNISAWTVGGVPIVLRTYIRFDDLAKIPSTAHVLSATFYLYGLSSSVVSPQGNYGANRAIIEPAEGPWDENTLTWNTQPKANDRYQVTLPKSTSQWNYDAVVDDVKGIVARAVKFPAKNYGARISMATEVQYRNLIFASSESADPTKRPKLVVTYSN